MTRNIYDTIIVGGGIAGLTSAVYLARAGQKVLLLEKNQECGGLVNSFTHNGFHFDVGVRALEDAGIILPMLKDLGIKLEVVKSDVTVGIENEILNVKDSDSIEQYRKLLVKVYPESEEEIGDFIKIMKKIMKHMNVLYGIENPIFKNLKRDKSYIFKKLLPWLPKFVFTLHKINRMNMPVEDYLKTIIKNESLRDIISQHFFKNTPTFFALSYFSLYMDYFYPVGGVGKISEAMKDKILEFNGEIKTSIKVEKVLASQCVVKDQNNVAYEYDNLIWAADLKTMYEVTDTNNLAPDISFNFESVNKQVHNCRGGDSVFSLFLKVNNSLENFSKISKGHFFYTPSKKGLGEIHRTELRSLLDNWDKLTKKQILSWLDKFAKLNTYEISIPGLKDKELVPEGKTGVIISFLAEYDLFYKVKESGWYEEFKDELESRVINVLSNSIYPNLKDNISAQFSFSPLSIKDRVGSSEGAITGWSFENPVPVFSKIQHADRSVITPIPSIFQAGQWTYSPAGVPMSILTGKLAADEIINKNKR